MNNMHRSEGIPMENQDLAEQGTDAERNISSPMQNGTAVIPCSLWIWCPCTVQMESGIF